MRRHPDIAGAAEAQGEAGSVLRYLRAHPDFLARNPSLYALLVPPMRSYGDTSADHMAAMLARARVDAAAARQAADALLDAERAGTDLAARVRACVLSLIGEDEIEPWLEETLPGLLGLDAAGLVREGRAEAQLAAGTLAAMLGGSAVVLLQQPVETDAAGALACALRGAAGLARHAACIRVPGAAGARALVLASRDRPITCGAAGLEALRFLGAAIGAALDATRDRRAHATGRPTRLRLVDR